MSLLMDALKKAEQSKRQGEPGSEISFSDLSHGLSLELIEPRENTAPSAEAPPPAKEPRVGLPELPTKMADLDHEFMASHTPPPEAKRSPPPEEPSPPPRREPMLSPPPRTMPVAEPPRSSAPPAADKDQEARQSVGNAFAAKEAPKAPKSKAFAITVGVTTLASVLGIGGYFWWQMQPKSSLAPPRMPTPPLPTPIAAPAPTPVAPTTSATSPAPLAPSAPAAVAASQPTPPPPSAASPAPSFAAPASNDKAVATPSEEAKPKREPAPAKVAAPQEPVTVSKSALRINPALTRGFDLFHQGDLAGAKKEYERVLKGEPQNTDALHGMAAIAVRDGRADLAEHFFQRILVADPQDAVAVSGLLNLRGRANPAAAEARLKAITAAQPDLAAAHFALGNLFASQERWQEAQPAYFKAYSADAGNPDILFNLAVSLEHLRQTKLAAQYYSLAVEAARRHPSGFDPAQAEARLRALQP